MPGGICSTVPSLYTINELKWKLFLLRTCTSCVIILTPLFHLFNNSLIHESKSKSEKTKANTNSFFLSPLIGAIKVCACAVVQEDVWLPKPIRGDPNILRFGRMWKCIEKHKKKKDIVKMKVAYIDIVVLRFIPTHEGVVPSHRQPGNWYLRNADQFNGFQILHQISMHRPNVCCQNLVLLVETYNLLEAGKIRFHIFWQTDSSHFKISITDKWTHETVNLRGTESSPFITGRSIEL